MFGVDQRKLSRQFHSSQLIHSEENRADELMLSLPFFLPIPAFHLETSLSIVTPDQFGYGDIDHQPTGVEIVLDDVGPGGLNEGVIMSYFEEFQVRIALVPPIEPRVSVHQLLCTPLHAHVI